MLYVKFYQTKPNTCQCVRVIENVPRRTHIQLEHEYKYTVPCCRPCAGAERECEYPPP